MKNAIWIWAFIAVGHAYGENGVTKNEIIIGSCSALSGPNREQGNSQITGALAYIRSINDEGGIHGRKIRLLAMDDGYERGKAILCYKRLLQKKVFAAAFLTGSAQAAVYAPRAEADKIPFIGFASHAEFLHVPFKRYIIAVRVTAADEFRLMVDHLWNDLKVRRIGVVYKEDAAGSAFLAALGSSLRRYGATPVVAAAYVSKPLAIDPAIRSVVAANPEVLFLEGIEPSVPEAIQKIRAGGFHSLIISNSRDLVRNGGTGVDNVVVSEIMPSLENTELPGVRHYHELLKRYFPKEKQGNFGIEGYIDAMILVEGLRRAGQDLTREKLIDAIESIHDFDLGMGSDFRANYSSENHKAFKQVHFNIIRKGKSVPLDNWKELADLRAVGSRRGGR